MLISFIKPTLNGSLKLLLCSCPEIHHVYHMCWVSEAGRKKKELSRIQYTLRSTDVSQVGRSS